MMQLTLATLQDVSLLLGIFRQLIIFTIVSSSINIFFHSYLFQHSSDPYPYPIITSLNPEAYEPFLRRSKSFCPQYPCADKIDITSTATKRQILNSFVNIVLSSIKSQGGPRVKNDHDILNKLPRIKSNIYVLNRQMSQSSKDILGKCHS